MCVSSDICCQVEVSASGWSLVQRSPTECGVYEYDHEVSTIKALVHEWLLRYWEGGGDERKMLSRISATGGLSPSFSLQIIDFPQIYVYFITSVSVCFSAPDGWTASNQCFEYHSWRREQRWFSKLWFTRCSTNWLGCQSDKISLNSVTLKTSDYVHEIWHSETNARNHSVTQYFQIRWELIYFWCSEISALGPVVDFVLKETIQPVVAVRITLRTRSHERPFFPT
jgi:hypothetical protein